MAVDGRTRTGTDAPAGAFAGANKWDPLRTRARGWRAVVDVYARG